MKTRVLRRFFANLWKDLSPGVQVTAIFVVPVTAAMLGLMVFYDAPIGPSFVLSLVICTIVGVSFTVLWALYFAISKRYNDAKLQVERENKEILNTIGGRNEI